jgi:hypothetical protein
MTERLSACAFRFQQTVKLYDRKSDSVLNRHTLTSSLAFMEERKLTSLIFGNVVIESQLMGAQVRVYGEGRRSYYLRPSPYLSIAVPLDDLREEISAEEATSLSEKIFSSVADEIEHTYPGGLEDEYG